MYNYIRTNTATITEVIKECNEFINENRHYGEYVFVSTFTDDPYMVYKDVMPGDDIHSTSEKMVSVIEDFPKLTGYFEFNGSLISVTFGKTPEEVVQQYRDERDKKYQEYLNSEQYKIDEREK